MVDCVFVVSLNVENRDREGGRVVITTKIVDLRIYRLMIICRGITHSGPFHFEPLSILSKCRFVHSLR